MRIEEFSFLNRLMVLIRLSIVIEKFYTLDCSSGIRPGEHPNSHFWSIEDDYLGADDN